MHMLKIFPVSIQLKSCARNFNFYQQIKNNQQNSILILEEAVNILHQMILGLNFKK